VTDEMTRRTKLVASAALLAVITWGVYGLWNDRRWPFATGTNDAAFLSTTFGMSAQEVRRSLVGHHATLLKYDEYRRSGASPMIEVFGTPVLSEDSAREMTLYMPGIAMVDSKVEAEFEFRDDRLRYVGAYFDPLSTKAEALVTRLDGVLRETYQFSGREQSQEVPGAYSLHFASASAKPTLWVNLTDLKKPIILLSILNPRMQADQQQEIEARERAAFGRRR
jgi:hypothetical protein